MNRTECEEMLSRALIGRMGVSYAGEPLILPVLFAYTKGAVVFRTAPGEKLDTVWVNASAAFEIDDWDLSTRKGWSVLVRGRTETVQDESEIAELESIGLASWVPDLQPTTWVRIRPMEITGRRIL
jgi:nitroimidazol reductase NimA-like FMN-containing flavoprotein (pyridoxamine 5'-phosphate oxidase superfamily)